MKKIYSFFSLRLIGLAVVGLLLASPANALIIEGEAPNFTLKSMSGKNLKLSEYRGQVVLINFWAYWCGPCREELPMLEKLYKRYKSLGFTILAINVGDDKEKAEKLLKEVKVSFPVLFDSTKKISEQYKIEAMPSTYIVDKDGNLRFKHMGYMPDYDAMYELEVKQLLKE